MAEWSGLRIAQEFCRRKGLPQPSTLTGATDDTTQQILGLMNEGIMEAPSRWDLTLLQVLVTFQHAGGTVAEPYLAYDLNTLPSFKHYITNTLWDITDRIQVAGPLTPKEWQVLTTMLISSSRYQFTFFNNHIQIFPVALTPPLPGPTNFTFFYQSRYGVFDPVPAAGALTDIYSSDQAYPLIPHEVILQDLKYRWLREKGLAYAEDQRSSETMWLNLCGNEPQPVLVLDAPDFNPYGLTPGLLIPAGNWNVP